ncbi:MAG: hypothetical protein RL720_728 [Actinomycetota bacterium]|jgi:hypothetical protein
MKTAAVRAGGDDANDITSKDTFPFRECGSDWLESGQKRAMVERDEIPINNGSDEVHHAICWREDFLPDLGVEVDSSVT